MGKWGIRKLTEIFFSHLINLINMQDGIDFTNVSFRFAEMASNAFFNFIALHS